MSDNITADTDQFYCYSFCIDDVDRFVTAAAATHLDEPEKQR